MFFRAAFLGLVALTPLPAAGSPYVEELVARARVFQLDEAKQWHRLLFLVPGWFSNAKPLLDAPGFFLSRGTEPRAELEATIRSFFRPDDNHDRSVFPPVNKHPRCLYPARFRWLEARLGFDRTRMPRVECERLDGFIADVDPAGMSLVFSSGYVSNPASMFGHTFFRLHRGERRSDDSASALLDHSLSFAAYPDGSKGLAYVVKGVAGGFPGLFDILPYYIKVQEYNNFESRDLWEYELELTPEQVKFLLYSVWEVGAHPMKYFYLDNNCASILLVLLEIADPRLQLIDRFNTWVVPGDVVRAVASSPGLIRRVRYRPSSLSRYLGRYELLKGDERDFLGELTRPDPAPEAVARLAEAPVESRARLIDATLEYIDYQEKLGGAKAPVEYGPLRSQLLVMRSETGAIAEALPPPRAFKDPRSGHGSVRLSASAGVGEGDGALLALGWRPALHDIVAPSSGYSGELEIRFFDFDARYAPSSGSLWLTRFGLLEILSVNAAQSLLVPLSWKLSLLMEEDPLAPAGRHRFDKSISGGAGFAVRPPGGGAHTVYALVGAKLGTSTLPGQNLHAGPQLTVGSVWQVAERLRLKVDGSWGWRLAAQTREDARIGAELSFRIAQDEELRLTGAWRGGRFQGIVGYSHYFWHVP